MQRLSEAHSTYLHLIRFIAAIAVLVDHLRIDGVDTGWMLIGTLSHEAVIVFFVLSGFVVYYSTRRAGRDAAAYAAARVSRIYGVALPAVVACSALAFALPSISAVDLSRLTDYRVPDLLNTLSSLLFLNESWTNESSVPLNIPYWTICYEVWFYVLFGIAWFGRGRARWLLLAAAVLIAGPKILALLPVWCMGALAAHWTHRFRIGRVTALAIAIACYAVMVLVSVSGLDLLVRGHMYELVPGFWRLGTARRMVTDHLLGALFALHLATLPILLAGPTSRSSRCLMRLAKPIAWAAGFSFTLYLFHRPMTQIIGDLAREADPSKPVAVLIVLGIIASCAAISRLTEHRATRLRPVLESLLRRKAPEQDVRSRARHSS